MKIAIVYNARPTEYERNDPQLEKHIEGDEWKTIEAIGEAVIQNGHSVRYFVIGPEIYEQLKKSKNQIDLLFNLSEGIGTGADRESHIPLICEILSIPYTGPSPLSSALILNKSRAKEIWRANGVRTALSQLFESADTVLVKTLSFPLIVKPNNEGSGIGIKSNSIVKNRSELKAAVGKIIEEYHQPALVEAFLPGREFTVAISGCGAKAKTLPIVEINFEAFPKDAPPIDSYEAKFVYGATGLSEMTKTEFCPAIIDKKLEIQINTLALAAYTSIGCRDFGRVDIRLDAHNIPYVMEINHPPGLMSDPNESSFFTIAGRAGGLTFKQLIGTILNSATSRLGL